MSASSEHLSVYDRGLHYGDGLFETIVCLHGVPRFLDDHLARLTGGCDRLGIAIPDLGALRARIAQCAQAPAAAPDCIVKVIVTRGETRKRGYAADAASVSPTCLVLRYPHAPIAPELLRSGMRVRVGALQLAESERLAGMKHLNRLEQVLARAEWSDPAIGESLLGSRSGALISGTMSNVFVVHGDVIHTPALVTCGVHGVMRAQVLREARNAGIAINEYPMPWSEVDRIREAFLTSSVLGVCPIRELSGRPLTTGAVTRRIQTLMRPLLGERGALDA